MIRTHNHLVRQQTLNHLGQFGLLVECSFTTYRGFESRCCHLSRSELKMSELAKTSDNRWQWPANEREWLEVGGSG